MLWYLFVAFLGIAGALASLFLWVGTPRLHEYTDVSVVRPHIFKNPERGVDRIRIAAVYFVPRDKRGSVGAGWRSILEENLKTLEIFHALQLRGRSVVTFAIYPEPVFGRAEQLAYDTNDTNRGNPRALLAISEELDKRVFSPNGDLYLPDFWKKEAGTYPVLFILYEGVGAIGGVIAESKYESASDIAAELGLPESVVFPVDVKGVDGFFLLSRTFLADPHYRAFGASLLAHEFYHTLGIPDEYEPDTEKPTSSDIMGLGRFRPIEKTYIQRETLRAVGL